MASRQKRAPQKVPHDERTCPASTMAQIPWLPKRNTTSEVTLANSDLYVMFFSHPASDTSSEAQQKSLEEIVFRLEIQQTFAESFPFYLPVRYHKMDTRQIFEASGSPGSYWINAIHFVRTTCSEYSTVPFYNINQQLKFPDPTLTTQNAEYIECKFKDFKIKGVPDLCEKAEEFLLEPWVLIQLPFQPALLHQWAVAAYAESLKFAKKLVEIGASGFAPQFSYVFSQLTRLCELLTENCHTFLSHFFTIYCDNPEESLITKINKFVKGYPELLSETLAILEFIFSDDCSKALKFIRSETLGFKTTELLQFSTQLAPTLCGRYDKTLTAYDECYWYAETLGPLCRPQPDHFALTPAGMNAEYPEILANNYCTKVQTTLELSPSEKSKVLEILDSLKLPLYKSQSKVFVNKNFLKKYMSTEDFLMLKSHAAFLDNIKGISCKAPAVKKGGVLLDILSLQADVHEANSIGVITSLMVRAAKKHDKTIDLVHLIKDTAPLEEEFSLRDFVDQVDMVIARRDLWMPRSILNMASDSVVKLRCITDMQADADFHERSTWNIQMLVLRMHEEYYAALELGNLFFYPEGLIVQYILPCFVAMATELQIGDGAKDLRKRQSCLEFVSSLIQSYEDEEFLESLGEYRKMHFNESADFDSDLKRLFAKVVDIIRHLFKDSKSTHSVIAKLSVMNVNPKDVPINHPRPQLFSPGEFKIQLSRLCHRILAVYMTKIVPNFDPYNLTFNDFLKTFKLLKNGASEVEKILANLQDKPKKSGAIPNGAIQKSVLRDSQLLTRPQLVGIAIFMVYGKRLRMSKFYNTYQKPLFLHNPLERTAVHFLMGKWWELKTTFAPFCVGAPCVDLSLIPIKVALQNACCQPLLKSLTPEKDRVRLDYPGQVTFNPILHCRMCGVVNAQSFRLCTECQDEPGYPHPNYFCSDECEKSALDTFHVMEHDKFVMTKLGL